MIVNQVNEDRILAEIMDTTYNGSIVHYRVSVPPMGETTEEFTKEVPSPNAIYNPGELVGLEIKGEKFQLFKDA